MKKFISILASLLLIAQSALAGQGGSTSGGNPNVANATGILPVLNGGTGGRDFLSPASQIYAQLPYQAAVDQMTPFVPSNNEATVIFMGTSISAGNGPAAGVDHSFAYADINNYFAGIYGSTGVGSCTWTSSPGCGLSSTGTWNHLNLGPYQASLPAYQVYQSTNGATVTAPFNGIGTSNEIDVVGYTNTDTTGSYTFVVGGSSAGTFTPGTSGSPTPFIQRIYNNGINNYTITNSGSGYTPGTYALGYTGGTCTTAPTGQYVVGGGNTVTSVQSLTPGICTVAPTPTFPSGGGSSAAATAVLAAWANPLGSGGAVITASGVIDIMLMDVRFRPSNVGRGVHTWNMGVAGASMTMFTPDLSWLAIVPNAKLAFVESGANDMGSPTTPTSLVATQTTIHNALVANNIAEVLLVTQRHSAEDSCVSNPPTTYCEKDYVAAELTWASQNKIPVVDVFDAWGTYASANAIGLYADGIHPSQAGADVIAGMMNNVIDPAVPTYDAGINSQAPSNLYGFHMQNNNKGFLVDGVNANSSIFTLKNLSGGSTLTEQALSDGNTVAISANVLELLGPGGNNGFTAQGNGNNTITSQTIFYPYGTTRPNNPQAAVDDDQGSFLVRGGGSLSISSCGGGSPAVAGASSSFTVTMGTGALTSCVINFGSGAFSTAPAVCDLQPTNSTAAAVGTTGAYVSAISTTQLTITGLVLTNASYGVHCY